MPQGHADTCHRSGNSCSLRAVDTVPMETIATFVGIANRDMLSEMGMSPGAIDEELKIVSIFKCTFQLPTVKS